MNWICDECGSVWYSTLTPAACVDCFDPNIEPYLGDEVDENDHDNEPSILHRLAKAEAKSARDDATIVSLREALDRKDQRLSEQDAEIAELLDLLANEHVTATKLGSDLAYRNATIAEQAAKLAKCRAFAEEHKEVQDEIIMNHWTDVIDQMPEPLYSRFLAMDKKREEAMAE